MRERGFPQSSAIPSEAGFTLIEMAIVLAIVGLLLGSGLLAVAPVLENAKRKATIERMDRIEDALVLYTIRNSRLPCPADGSLANSNANYGSAQPATATTACTITGGTSVVPWRTLGLEEALSSDGWGNRFTYQVTVSTLTNTNTMLRSGSTYPSGTLVVNNIAGTEVTNSTDRAAYVLISHGKQAIGAYTGAPSPTLVSGPGTASAGETANNDGATPFVQNQQIDLAGSIFDDIVRWRTAAYIINACGSGSCGNP
jgi:prepilin-type N-terminal cleavage/methylation domain-containing protein